MMASFVTDWYIDMWIVSTGYQAGSLKGDEHG